MFDDKDDLQDRTFCLNGHNYAIWVTNMETLLKNKGLWKYMKTIIVDFMDVDAEFIIDVKNDDVVAIIIAYISRKICFQTSEIDCPDSVWNKYKSMFNEVNDGTLCN